MNSAPVINTAHLLYMVRTVEKIKVARYSLAIMVVSALPARLFKSLFRWVSKSLVMVIQSGSTSGILI